MMMGGTTAIHGTLNEIEKRAILNFEGAKLLYIIIFQ